MSEYVLGLRLDFTEDPMFVDMNIDGKWVRFVRETPRPIPYDVWREAQLYWMWLLITESNVPFKWQEHSWVEMPDEHGEWSLAYLVMELGPTAALELYEKYGVDQITEEFGGKG